MLMILDCELLKDSLNDLKVRLILIVMVMDVYFWKALDVIRYFEALRYWFLLYFSSEH